MDLKYPRRLLVLGAPDCDIARAVKGLTGSAPQPDTSGSLAGATHEWSIRNDYYNADVPIWIDEINDIEQWKIDFLKPEAKEVIDAVGAWVYCFSDTSIKSPEHLSDNVVASLHAIEDIIQNAREDTFDGPCIALDLSPHQAQSEALEAQCMEYGFEYIYANATGKNEFGELQGFERFKEVLETNDWADQSSPEAEESDAHDDLATEKAQVNAELWDLKASLLAPETDIEGDHESENFDIENMDQIFGQILAIKDTTAGVPEQQRRAFAESAINKLMKDML